MKHTSFREIPRIIHKVYIEHSMDLNIKTFDKYTQEAHDSWKLLNPGYEIRYYSGNDCRNYLRKHYGELLVHAFDALKAYSSKCNLFRYCVLYIEGGFYSDWKQICTKPLDTYISPNIKWFSNWDLTENTMMTGFICSCPKHPVLFTAIVKCLSNIINDEYGISPIHTTGPGVLGHAFMACYPLIKWGEIVLLPYMIVDNFVNSPPYMGVWTAFYEIVVIHKHPKLPQDQNWSKGNNYNTLWENKDIYDVKLANKIKLLSSM